MTAPHDRPDIGELVTSVREFLEGDVAEGTEGRLRFHARVAANVLGMVERELSLGPGQERDHSAGLGKLGMRDEAELAAAIRSGQLDGRRDEVVEMVRSTVRAKLAVAHPGYADDATDPT